MLSDGFASYWGCGAGEHEGCTLEDLSEMDQVWQFDPINSENTLGVPPQNKAKALHI